MTCPRTDLLGEDSALCSLPCVFFMVDIATVKKKKKKWMYFSGREPIDFTVLMIKNFIIYPTFYIVVLHLLLSWCKKTEKKKLHWQLNLSSG